MKLKEGLYENLITNELQQVIKDTCDNGLVCKIDDIDEAELPSMLAEYIKKLVRNKLDDNNLTAEEQTSLVNRLIDFLGNDCRTDEEKIDEEKIEEDKIADDKMLAEVISANENISMQVTNREKIRPLTGFRTSNLFTGGQSDIPLNTEISRDIQTADKIYLIVSFLKLSGINLIYDDLKRFCNNPQHQLRIITTTYCGATDAKAVERLSKLPNTEIRISYNTRIERLHAKAYIFERNSGFSTAYIGSSNLSKSAQTDGLEWNIRVTNVENPHIIKTAMATFERYWSSNNFEDFRIGGIEKFYLEVNKERQHTGLSTTLFAKYTILPHQKEILDKLAIQREKGICRNLIVAATGTGKTVISAFDYKQFCNTHPNANRILFVAHRQEILRQSLLTYRSVLIDSNFGELWVGDYKPMQGIDHLFISVQTFNSQFEDVFKNLPSDYYQYIVIDECHHSAADSYRKILSHFNPELLIGLTATPERMDGVSLLPDFDNTISAEIRLTAALNAGLLTPFQYLCISDDTDLRDDDLMQGNQYIAAKLTERLCNSQRVALIVDRLNYYLPDETACKALGFCSTMEHAKYMAEQFCAYGYKADYLTSERSEERDVLNKKLSRGDINYLFVVDIFNEGVDIPEVDTVLFLRPTESLTIFLQQLGRGLRLSPGKQLLTVFDFVAQLNKKYDFTSRFRSLMIRQDKSVIDQVKQGFTQLPNGCSIHMEEKAQQYVLENIKSAIYDKRRLVNELRTYDHEPTLQEFINNNGQDIRLIYKNNVCWTSLKREAGLCDYSDDYCTQHYTKGLSNLLHINSTSILLFIRHTLDHLQELSFDQDNDVYATLFYYMLYGEKISKTPFDTREDAIAALGNHPLFIAEIRQLVDYLLSQISVKTFPIGNGMPQVLEQYGCYTREEVFIIFEKQTIHKRMQGSVSGVFEVEDRNTELLFVTLNKSDKDFSPSTLYDDYVVSEYQFHWQSQNKDSHAGSGLRFVEQAKNKKKFLLFVREYKKDGFGNTCPFICFGLVDYISSTGDKPMSINWKMQQPILPQFLKIG